MYSRDSDKCGVPSVEQIDKNLRQDLIMIVFKREYKISIIKG